MRHVTDGELHAFLDGALDLLPGDRGRDVREHLASCSVCQERLQDEERLRSEATEILAAPTLGRLPMPTFEELREKAETADPQAPWGDQETEPAIGRRGPLKGLPLAWAATIILALGVGWMGGQVWHTLPTDEGPPAGSRYAPPDVSSLQRADLPVDAAEGEEGRVSTAELRERSAPPETVEAAPAPARETGAEGETPAAGEVAVGVAAADVTAAEPPRAGGEPSAWMGALEAPSPVMEEARRKTLDDLGATPGTVETLENSLALPGLRVVSIEWEEKVPGEKALLIRQLLSPGDTLELRYLGLLLGAETETGVAREVVAPSEVSPRIRRYANVLEASLPSGWNQVVMERGRGLLVARGPVSDRSLKALVKTLH